MSSFPKNNTHLYHEGLPCLVLEREFIKSQTTIRSIQTRITRARDLFRDVQISKEEYDEMVIGLQVERHHVEVRLQRLTEADV